MRIKQELTLKNSTPSRRVFSTTPLSTAYYSTCQESKPVTTRSGATQNHGSLRESSSGNVGGDGGGGEESLKLSYIILNDHISETNAISLLGRVVGNVKSPLQHYAPIQNIPGAEIPELQSSASMSSSGTRRPKRPRSTLSEKSTVSSTGTTVNEQPLGIDPSLLVFRNLPCTIGESASATLSHYSHYTKESKSLLTSLLGLSLKTSKKSWKEFKLESKLIRTVSLTQHDLIWSNLLKAYKSSIMSAVRKCGGTMFLVVGVKIARDAEVEVNIEGEKGLGGKLEVDAGAYIGVKGIGVGRITGGRGGVVGIASMDSVKGTRRQQKETIHGDRAFAVEYREVRLKIKMEIGKQNGKQKSKGKEDELQASDAKAEVAGLNMGNGSGGKENELLRAQREKNELLERRLNELLERRLKDQAEMLEVLKAQQAAMAEALQQQPYIQPQTQEEECGKKFTASKYCDSLPVLPRSTIPRRYSNNHPSAFPSPTGGSHPLINIRHPGTRDRIPEKYAFRTSGSEDEGEPDELHSDLNDLRERVKRLRELGITMEREIEQQSERLERISTSQGPNREHELELEEADTRKPKRIRRIHTEDTEDVASQLDANTPQWGYDVALMDVALPLDEPMDAALPLDLEGLEYHAGVDFAPCLAHQEVPDFVGDMNYESWINLLPPPILPTSCVAPITFDFAPVPRTPLPPGYSNIDPLSPPRKSPQRRIRNHLEVNPIANTQTPSTTFDVSSDLKDDEEQLQSESDDDYELELGDEVYVQELDALL